MQEFSSIDCTLFGVTKTGATSLPVMSVMWLGDKGEMWGGRGASIAD